MWGGARTAISTAWVSPATRVTCAGMRRRPCRWRKGFRPSRRCRICSTGNIRMRWAIRRWVGISASASNTCGAWNEDRLKYSEGDFLKQHGGSWTARRAREFSVGNIHAMEIPATPERIFPELGGQGLLLPARRWKLLLGLRLAIGKLFGWDRGMVSHPSQPLEVGRHYGFFAIE